MIEAQTQQIRWHQRRKKRTENAVFVFWAAVHLRCQFSSVTVFRLEQAGSLEIFALGEWGDFSWEIKKFMVIKTPLSVLFAINTENHEVTKV